jgi:hypothetical protein
MAVPRGSLADYEALLDAALKEKRSENFLHQVDAYVGEADGENWNRPDRPAARLPISR